MPKSRSPISAIFEHTSSFIDPRALAYFQAAFPCRLRSTFTRGAKVDFPCTFSTLPPTLRAGKLLRVSVFAAGCCKYCANCAFICIEVLQ